MALTHTPGLISVSINAPGHFVAHQGKKSSGKAPICIVVEGSAASLLSGLMMKIQPLPAPPPPPPGWELQIGEGCVLKWINKEGKQEQLAGPLTCDFHLMGPMTIC